MRNYQREFVTVQEAWRLMFPDQPPQQETYIRSWLRMAGSLQNLLDWIDYVAEVHKANPLRNPGAWLSSRLSKPQPQSEDQ
jgi:hypothetical protein